MSAHSDDGGRFVAGRPVAVRPVAASPVVTATLPKKALVARMRAVAGSTARRAFTDCRDPSFRSDCS